MLTVRDAPPEHYPWIADRASCCLSSSFRAIEAVDEQGEIAAMVGFDPWTPNSVSLHLAIKYPAAGYRLLEPTFRVVFQNTRRKVALASAISSNHRSINLIKRLGFRETYRVLDGWSDGVDLVHFEMRRDECRWLRKG